MDPEKYRDVESDEDRMALRHPGERPRAGLQDIIELIPERIIRQVFHFRERQRRSRILLRQRRFEYLLARVGCDVDRSTERELQPVQLDLAVEVQRGGGSPIEQLIQSHTVVRSAGLVLMLLQLSLSESELRPDEISLSRLVRRVLSLGYVNDLLQV